MVLLIPLTAFDQELEENAGLLAQLGEVNAHRADSATDVVVTYVVDAPGYGLPTQAVFEFVEGYRRSAEGWLRLRYKYEFRPAASRRAHHSPHRTFPRLHQHCEPPGQRVRAHYEDHERLLRPIAEEFSAEYASGRPIQCPRMRRIRTTGAED